MMHQFTEPFTFLQMNFWEGRLFYPVQNFLNRERPDIMSAQEILHGDNCTPGYMTGQQLIKDRHFDGLAIGGAMDATTMKDAEQVTLCATFFRNGIVCEEIHVIPILYPDEEKIPSARLNRDDYYSLLHCVLRLPDGTRLHALNHHGELFIGTRLGHPQTRRNYRRIADYIATLSGPLIISGDFNLTKESPSLQPLKDLGLKNLNDLHNIKWARNEFSWNDYEAVNHVFISDDIAVDEYRVIRDNISDHCPLLMKCRIKKSA